MSLGLLIPLSIGMGLIGLAAFIWALNHDQFDDPDGNAQRILMPGNPIHKQRAGEAERTSHTDDDTSRTGL